MGLFSPEKLPGPPLVSEGLRCPCNAPGVVVFPRSSACWGLAFCKHMSSRSGHVYFSAHSRVSSMLCGGPASWTWASGLQALSSLLSQFLSLSFSAAWTKLPQFYLPVLQLDIVSLIKIFLSEFTFISLGGFLWRLSPSGLWSQLSLAHRAC